MIKIIQKCDGCQATRELKDLHNATDGGWRPVTGLKHLCAECIRKAVGDAA